MPPTPESDSSGEKSLQEVVADLGLYPIEAFQFVQQGLSQTIVQLHGEPHLKAGGSKTESLPEEEQISRHISGQELAEGLRLYALEQWLDDFRDVFDFKTAFENAYQIGSCT